MGKPGKYVSVSLPPYWIEWCDKIISSGIRRSRAEIAVEGLKAIQYGLDRAYEERKEVEAEVKERHQE
jgi:hypothetical protein